MDVSDSHLDYLYGLARIEAMKTGRDYNELVQDGAIGLMDAARSFDRSSDVTFEAFAYPHAVFATRRRRMPLLVERENCVSLDEPIGEDEYGDEITLHDVIPDQSHSFLALSEANRELHAAIDNLAPQEWEVITRCDLYGETHQMVADSHAVSRQYITKVRESALSHLHEMLAA